MKLSLKTTFIKKPKSGKSKGHYFECGNCGHENGYIESALHPDNKVTTPAGEAYAQKVCVNCGAYASFFDYLK